PSDEPGPARQQAGQRRGEPVRRRDCPVRRHRARRWTRLAGCGWSDPSGGSLVTGQGSSTAIKANEPEVESVPLKSVRKSWICKDGRMARLILLNGPPAAGKSTLARRWVADHPFALNLDLDRIWEMIGGWQQDYRLASSLACRLAAAMAGTHLRQQRDVIVPQFLGRPRFIDELAGVAA